jgi:hypothetical protein
LKSSPKKQINELIFDWLKNKCSILEELCDDEIVSSVSISEDSVSGSESSENKKPEKKKDRQKTFSN